MAQSSEERIVFDLRSSKQVKPNTANIGIRASRKSQKKLKDRESSHKKLLKLSKSSKKSKDKASKQSLTLVQQDVQNSDLMIVDCEQDPEKG